MCPEEMEREYKARDTGLKETPELVERAVVAQRPKCRFRASWAFLLARMLHMGHLLLLELLHDSIVLIRRLCMTIRGNALSSVDSAALLEVEVDALRL